MKIENRSIQQLANDPNNARKHSDKNLMAIKGSLAKFGQQKPLVVDENNVVIAGNGTLEAARQLGWTEIQVVVSSLDKIDKMAFALADNKTSDLSEWDADELDRQLEELADLDFDLSDIGFDLNEDIDFEFKDPGDPNPTKVDDNKLTVICESLASKEKLFAELNDRGYKVK